MNLETPAWLDTNFVQKVLRHSEKDNSIEVKTVFVKPATSKGDNYGSDMFRVSVAFIRKKGGMNFGEDKSIIVKAVPTEEGSRREIILSFNIFDTEISMMTNTLNKMNDLLKNGRRISGSAFYAQPDPKLIVMEDLSVSGFRMADRRAGLDLPHSILAIRGLGRFHAASVALCEKEPDHSLLYRLGMFNDDVPKEMRGFFTVGTETLANQVETWPELGKRYADKIRNFTKQLYELGKDAIKPHSEFNVINHGDSWVNNMLFKYDDNGKPIEHIFVDFQVTVYSSPAVDLLYFLSTSTSAVVFDNHQEELLEEYQRTLSTTMQEMGCKTEAPTIDDLKGHMKERSLYGMIASFTVLPAILTDPEKALTLDQMLNKDGSTPNPGYLGETYRKMMIKRIPMYEEMGLLDF